MAERTLNIYKRFSLASVGAGWENCYLNYRPATIGDMESINDLATNDMSDAEAVKFMIDQVRSHIIGGKVSTLDEQYVAVEVDFEKSDLDLLPVETVLELYSEMSGKGLDPKATPSEATESDEPSSENEPTATA